MTARDRNYEPIAAGDPVRRVQGRAEDIGRSGTVAEVHGSIAGDTLITIRSADGSEWRCYDRQVEVVPMAIVEAWDLIGHEGCFRIRGGRATYEAVLYNSARAKGSKVRLARLESTPDGLRQVNRWVPADQPIEVLHDYDGAVR